MTEKFPDQPTSGVTGTQRVEGKCILYTIHYGPNCLTLQNSSLNVDLLVQCHQTVVIKDKEKTTKSDKKDMLILKVQREFFSTV